MIAGLLFMSQQAFASPLKIQASPTASIQKVAAVVNIAGGSVERGSGERLQSLISDFGLSGQVNAVEPREIEKAVGEAVSSAPDLVIVLAGDGTARLAAQLCGNNGPLVAPLPGGTMNMLPNALYNGLGWHEALKLALSEGTTRYVGGGQIGEHRFYVAAILGAPALWAPAREAVRHLDLGSAWAHARHAWSNAFAHKLRFQLAGGDKRKAEALTIMCPLVSRACEDQTAFEVAALDPENAAEAFRLGFSMLRDDWRNDPSVSVERSQHVKAWARQPIPAILDGEMQMLGSRAEVTFEPKAFRALVPASFAAGKNGNQVTAEHFNTFRAP